MDNIFIEEHEDIRNRLIELEERMTFLEAYSLNLDYVDKFQRQFFKVFIAFALLVSPWLTSVIIDYFSPPVVVKIEQVDYLELIFNHICKVIFAFAEYILQGRIAMVVNYFGSRTDATTMTAHAQWNKLRESIPLVFFANNFLKGVVVLVYFVAFLAVLKVIYRLHNMKSPRQLLEHLLRSKGFTPSSASGVSLQNDLFLNLRKLENDCYDQTTPVIVPVRQLSVELMDSDVDLSAWS